MSDMVRVPVGGDGELRGRRRGRIGAPAVVLLHAGVADHRSFNGVFDALAGDDLDLIAYDRRGFGATGWHDATFTHLADLVAVLDSTGIDRAVIVGNSMGGALALDLAATAPGRVEALVLLAPAVSGMTDEGESQPYEAGPATDAIQAAIGTAADDAERARLLLHLWLDGPAQLEGRVGGEPRQRAESMVRRMLEIGAPEDSGESGLDVWSALTEVDVPALVAWGDLDVPGDLRWYEEVARRLPRSTTMILQGCAHLPSVERPDLVAGLIREWAQ